MSDLTTLTVRLTADLKRELEDRARLAHFSVDELVGQMIRDCLFRNSAEYFDPTSERAQRYRMVEEGMRDAYLGHTVPLDEAMKAIRQQLGATKPKAPSSKT